MKLLIGTVAMVSGVLFAVSMASANPALLPKHEGYPMKNSGSPVNGQPTANDPGRPPNFARYTFLDEGAQRFYPHWDQAADICVAILRTEAGRDPHDNVVVLDFDYIASRQHFIPRRIRLLSSASESGDSINPRGARNKASPPIRIKIGICAR